MARPGRSQRRGARVRSPQISEQLWNQHKEEIIKEYRARGKRGMMTWMKNTHSFVASWGQYNYHLYTKWGIGEESREDQDSKTRPQQIITRFSFSPGASELSLPRSDTHFKSRSSRTQMAADALFALSYYEDAFSLYFAVWSEEPLFNFSLLKNCLRSAILPEHVSALHASLTNVTSSERADEHLTRARDHLWLSWRPFNNESDLTSFTAPGAVCWARSLLNYGIDLLSYLIEAPPESINFLDTIYQLNNSLPSTLYLNFIWCRSIVSPRWSIGNFSTAFQGSISTTELLRVLATALVEEMHSVEAIETVEWSTELPQIAVNIAETMAQMSNEDIIEAFFDILRKNNHLRISQDEDSRYDEETLELNRAFITELFDIPIPATALSHTIEDLQRDGPLLSNLDLSRPMSLPD